jgi:NTP pyrophosphatase (non-canonical NTP hydrolase)
MLVELKNVQLWECPDCGFRFDAIHADGTCPACHEVDTREEVRWFAVQMEAKLKENDHKGGWDNCQYRYLLDRLREEVDELIQAFWDQEKTTEDIVSEAADVANFAMMIADKTRKQFPPAV